MKFVSFFYASLLALCVCSCNKQTTPQMNREIAVADSLLTNILSKYNVEKYGLLSETYPVNPDNQVTYLAEGSEQKKNQEVSFLWPYSGMLSGGIALYEVTGNEKYLKVLEERILPGLELYWDNTRSPFCYQSYPLFNGESDRFYDDNDWLAIDFCDLYALTQNPQYLLKAKVLHDYIYSGWDDELGGGIYWCEQKKTSKNTCSNAPAAVLCMKLYNLTKEQKYLDQAIATYNWTKENLCDPEDAVYWDNIGLNKNIGKAKFTYNSGQMIQAGVLLYQATSDKTYLTDAQRTAKGSYNHFLTKHTGVNGKDMYFYPANSWFNVILLRGLIALAEVDNNYEYVNTMADNARYAWDYTRDENGFLGNDWTGGKNKKFKWLLDNACMIELFAKIGNI